MQLILYYVSVYNSRDTLLLKLCNFINNNSYLIKVNFYMLLELRNFGKAIQMYSIICIYCVLSTIHISILICLNRLMKPGFYFWTQNKNGFIQVKI